MRIAIPVRQGRISPVFDAARYLWIVDIEDGREAGRSQTVLSQKDPMDRARHVSRCGAKVLICGAISRSLRLVLASSGVEVIPSICGSAEEIIAAFSEDRLSDDRFHMPGAKGARQARAGSGSRRAAVGRPRSQAPQTSRPNR